jgi:hypothetical protein
MTLRAKKRGAHTGLRADLETGPARDLESAIASGFIGTLNGDAAQIRLGKIEPRSG